VLGKKISEFAETSRQRTSSQIHIQSIQNKATMKSIHRFNLYLVLVLLTMPKGTESNKTLENCQARVFATRRAVRYLNCPLPPFNDQMTLAYCQVALLQIKIRLRICRRKPKVHYATFFHTINSFTRRSTMYYMNNIDIYKTKS
jgi:hypothetical protein